MTDEQHGPSVSDPKDAPIADERPGDGVDPDDRHPLKGDQEEPDVKPFAGDDDILSGHGPGAIE
jgi:hypothetical protein